MGGCVCAALTEGPRIVPPEASGQEIHLTKLWLGDLCATPFHEALFHIRLAESSDKFSSSSTCTNCIVVLENASLTTVNGFIFPTGQLFNFLLEVCKCWHCSVSGREPEESTVSLTGCSPVEVSFGFIQILRLGYNKIKFLIEFHKGRQGDEGKGGDRMISGMGTALPFLSSSWAGLILVLLQI